MSISQDETAEIDMLENDDGLEDGGLTLTVTSPQNGGTDINSSVVPPTVYYVPDPGFAGQDGFQYQVTDADGDSSVASVSVQVNCPECALGVTLLLEWDRNPVEESVTGYRVFFGLTDVAADMEKIEDITLPPEPDSTFDPAAPSIAFDAWARLGLYRDQEACFRLKAYNSAADSEKSDSPALL